MGRTAGAVAILSLAAVGCGGGVDGPAQVSADAGGVPITAASRSGTVTATEQPRSEEVERISAFDIEPSCPPNSLLSSAQGEFSTDVAGGPATPEDALAEGLVPGGAFGFPPAGLATDAQFQRVAEIGQNEGETQGVVFSHTDRRGSEYLAMVSYAGDSWHLAGEKHCEAAAGTGPGG